MDFFEKSLAAKKNILGKLREAQCANPIKDAPFEENTNPIYSDTNEDLGLLFQKNFEAIQGNFFKTKNIQEAIDLINLWQQENQWTQIYNTSFTDLGLQEGDDILLAQVAITRCDALIARTGSIVFSSAIRGGRTATIYPPIHIVLAFVSQLKNDISDFTQDLDLKNLPSMINFNTGPSRTADIEKTLVVGIHGPKEVNLILIENE